MSSSDSIDENELHAYVDQELDAESRAKVEAWLVTHPDDRARVELWFNQIRGFHSIYDRVMNEPLPQSLLDLLRPPADPRG